MPGTPFRFIVMLAVVSLSAGAGCATAVRQAERAMRPAPDARPVRRQARAAEPAPDAAITVRPGHPRLFVATDWPAATDAVARDWQALLIKRADDLAAKPFVAYSPKRLLTRSREALKRLSLYAGVYRFTRDRKYADLGRRELLNVCGFDDWNPDDFLATAEMMTAAGIAYDWLHDALSPDDRATAVRGIVRLGLKPALHEYEIQSGWTRATHNWNCVCNGGVIVAALAVAEEEPAVARRALSEALASIKYGLSIYDEHGGTVEGPMYHSYATRYLTFAAAALQTAAPASAALLRTKTSTPPTPGSKAATVRDPRPDFHPWAFAPTYRLAMTGPSGLVANFGDSSDALGNTAWILWIASQTRDDEGTIFQTRIDHDDPSIFDLLWYDPGLNRSVQTNMGSAPGPTEVFGSAVTLRSHDDQTFLALRTGSTADHHSHLDLGNFVLDMLGQRFAADLGPDEYGLPGYLTNRRADYLRTSTPGHNTLTMNGESQPGDVAAAADDKSEGTAQVARIDLTAAYPGSKSVVRTATLDGQTVTIVDDIRGPKSAAWVWHLHTPAKVTPVRGGAILESNGRRVEMNVVEPDGATLTAGPDVTRPPQRPVEGSTHVRLALPPGANARVRVEFRPAR